MSGNSEGRLLFIVRRACLLGKVKRSDVERKMGVSKDTARLDLLAAAERWPDYLEHTPSHGVTVRPFSVPPAEVSGATFLALMQRTAPVQELGLSTDEPGFQSQAPRFWYQGEHSPDLVMTLLRACLIRQPIDLEYVGLRLGETRKVRTVVPVELELLGQQWRLVAHDVDVKKKELGVEQKSFVLARILHAQRSTLWRGKRLHYPDGTPVEMHALKVNRSERDYQVTLNRQLTSDQVQAVAREFALVQRGELWLMRMPERNLVEFKRDHCAKSVMPADEDELKDFVQPIFEGVRPYVSH